MPRNRIARLNANGTVEETSTFNAGAGANGSVNSIALQLDGKILIAGDFTEVNGQPREAVARLLPDGTLESRSTFDTSVSLAGWGTSVVLVQQEDGKIIVDGARRLHPSGARDTSYQDPRALTDRIYSLVLAPAGDIFLGGRFPVDSLPVQTVYGVARVCGTGSNITRYPPLLDRFDSITLVRSLALQANGKLVGGGPRDVSLNSLITRLNADGSTESATTFNAPLVSQGIYAVAVEAGGGIIIAGSFATVNGQPRAKLARLLNDPAVQTLTIVSGGATVKWLRGGSAPEVSLVTFERSTDAGQRWTLLGRGVRIAGGWQITGLSLPADASLRARGCAGDGTSTGLVEQTINLPDIAVEFPAGTILDDGRATVDFGPAPAGGLAKTFALRNNGTVPLLNLAGTVTGVNAGDFAVTGPPPASLVPGAVGEFSVTFTPGGAGPRTATLQVASNDPDENPFDIALTGRQATASEAWRMQYFGSPDNTGSAADLSDPDNDGLVNLLEFATLSHPLEFTAPPGTLVKNGASLEFTYSRPVAALAEVSYRVEASGILSTAWTILSITSTILSDDGITQVVTATVPAGTGKRFVRLRVTRL